ncbi:hypothetical protein [Xenophilus sp. Marseille-Q4582]|uniref:hypothetical protein n=1 Tax=Xenophilus sp. Marseille-Q4582 TaxID=2866600 RepID=UPI001CE45333|nr:hypothetical protein [Xenophilus sp. Marseille-Q4582]
MSLPIQAVDRIFIRMAATYGAAWDRSLGAAPLGDVKAAWAHELAGFSDRLGLIAWALENLPEQVPNVIVFRNLCRRAPVEDAPRIEHQPASPERVAAELRKLGPTLARPPASANNRAWAHRILSRHEGGARITPAVLEMARDAAGRGGAAC